MTSHRMRLLPLVLVLLAAAACSEDLTTPANCPALCPGGQGDVFSIVLSPVNNLDSTFQGYLPTGQGGSLLVSDAIRAGDDRAVIRFFPRSDSIQFADTVKVGYSIDSVAFEVSILARDTAVNGLSVFFYRLPATIDSSLTFQALEDSLNPNNLIDSVAVADSVITGKVRLVLTGADLAKVAIPVADTGVLAIGLRIRADQPTGVRLGSSKAGSSSPVFFSYVKADTADTALQRRAFSRFPSYNSWRGRNPPALNPDRLTIGGDSTARALIRFALPDGIRDSAIIIRATLELEPFDSLFGLRGDSAIVQVRNLLADFGAKSPPATTFVGEHRIAPDVDTTITVEVTGLVRQWQGSSPLPSTLLIALAPEGSTFMRGEFGSTRAGVSPRLTITYELPFPFERP